MHVGRPERVDLNEGHVFKVIVPASQTELPAISKLLGRTTPFMTER